MNTDYLNHFDIFLDYKSKLLSKKSELQKCNECENNFEIKIFSTYVVVVNGHRHDLYDQLTKSN